MGQLQMKKEDQGQLKEPKELKDKVPDPTKKEKDNVYVNLTNTLIVLQNHVNLVIIHVLPVKEKEMKIVLSVLKIEK